MKQEKCSSMIIKIDNKEYKIEKLPLGKYAELLDALDKIPSQLEGLESLSEKSMLQALPKMLKEAFPELVTIISIGSGIPEDDIRNNFGLTDVAKVVKAIFEVNEFGQLKKVVGDLKKSPEIKSGLKD